MRQIYIGLLISIILMTTPLVALARGGTAGGESDMTRHMKYEMRMAEKNLYTGRMLLKMKDTIGLTAEQTAKIEKMEAAHKEVRDKRDAEIKALFVKLDAYLKEEKIDRAELERKLRAIAVIRTDMQIESINHLLDLRELLTASQLAKIDELKKEHRHKMMDKKKWRKHQESPKDKEQNQE